MFKSLKIFLSSRSQEENYRKEGWRLVIIISSSIFFLLLYFFLEISSLFQMIMLGLCFLCLYFFILSICRFASIKEIKRRYGHKRKFRWKPVSISRKDLLDLIIQYEIPIKIEFLYGEITHLIGKDLVQFNHIFFLDKKEFKYKQNFIKAFDELIKNQEELIVIQSLNDDDPSCLKGES